MKISKKQCPGGGNLNQALWYLQMAKTARGQFCHVEVIFVQYSHKSQQHILNCANS
jgi:hypothetical protein